MPQKTVKIVLQTADRTRVASLMVSRDMRVSDIIKTGTRRWSLRTGTNYQVANLTTGKQLLPGDRLSIDKVTDGDNLMLQPLPTHGGA